MHRDTRPPDERQPQGTQTQSGQGDGEPKFVTVEDLNRAISSRLGDFKKSLAKEFEGITTTIGAKLEELVTSKLESFTATQTTTDPKDQTKGGSNAADIENHPKFKGLEKQMAAMTAASEKLRAERDAEKKAAREQTLRGTLASELAKLGIDAKHVRSAAGILIDVEKSVRFADDDSTDIVFGELDLQTGLKDWVKTDEAKIFLPPRGTQGAGERPGGRPSGGAGTNGNQQQPMSAGRAILEMAKLFPTSGNSE